MAGSFTGIKQCTSFNCIIYFRSKYKLFHIKILKRYYSRAEDQVKETLTNTLLYVSHANNVLVIEKCDEKSQNGGFSNGIQCSFLKHLETWKYVNVDANIHEPQ